jgi:hypothetical protein
MKKRATDSTKTARVKKAAVSFIRLGLAPGRRAMAIAPRRGRKMIIDR